MGNAASGGYSAAGAEEASALRHGPPSVVRAALLAARERTLRLAQDYRAALGPQLRVPHAEELNPPLWELGHVAWFQEWWIARNPQRALGTRADPGVQRPASLLPSADAWYDSSRVAHGTRWDLPLPDSEATAHYLEGTLAGTLELLDALPRDAGDDALYFYRLAVVHEQMHAEAAVYMGQGLGIPLREGDTHLTGTTRGELQVPASRFTLGTSGGGFAFDNELGPHEVELAPFAIDAEPVTWAAFLPFVEAGGYEDPQWWTPEGRAWLAGLRQRRPVEQPSRQDQFALHLCAHEADAWCRWAGRRLPTEAEWECAALTDPGFRWGQVWEWTASRFEPYPGFAPHPYRDYSQPWFGNRRVLRGASEATAPALAHARYRNFYEPHRRDILAGFRSVRTGDGSKPSAV